MSGLVRIETADRIRTKGASSGAICHAVSTSAAYEARVLVAIASIGEGSVRRAERPAESIVPKLAVMSPNWLSTTLRPLRSMLPQSVTTMR